MLVAVAFYPDDKGNKRLFYTHVRNRYYVRQGIDVTVLNFNTDHNYEIDGISVISLDTYKSTNIKYDLLICHAANIRNHYIFLKKYNDKFRKIIFFFHGHEIMHISRYYPKPYKFNRKLVGEEKARYIYDSFKLTLWKSFFINNKNKIQLVFVSSWLKAVFLSELRINLDSIKDKTVVIHNSVGNAFEIKNYSINKAKAYDFITIRNHLDNSTYGIDLVVSEAKRHPNYKFCVIGKGKYFDYNAIPNNMEVIKKELSHDEIIDYLDKSRCGLMFTREDTQGVMTCEMATYGIPVITSNIYVCREIFRDFKNVGLVDNENIDLLRMYNYLLQKEPYKKNLIYSYKNTVEKEIDLIKSIV